MQCWTAAYDAGNDASGCNQCNMLLESEYLLARSSPGIAAVNCRLGSSCTGKAAGLGDIAACSAGTLTFAALRCIGKVTAAAVQVLAGALQDNERATIVGETTFGKGLIQTIVELSDGSAVVVTVARYQVPAA